MKKRSILVRVGIVAAALTLATTSMMSGTLARYAMTGTVNAEAAIAKWDPKITANTEALVGTSVTVNLVDTLDGTYNKIDESKVGDGTTKKIAPGTKGSFPIKVDMNDAEVPTELKIAALIPSGKTVPNNLSLKLMDGASEVAVLEAKTTKDGTGDVTYTPALTGTKAYLTKKGAITAFSQTFKSKGDTVGSDPTTKEYTLQWEWPLTNEDGVNNSGDAYNAEDLKSQNQNLGFELILELQQATGK